MFQFGAGFLVTGLSGAYSPGLIEANVEMLAETLTADLSGAYSPGLIEACS